MMNRFSTRIEKPCLDGWKLKLIQLCWIFHRMVGMIPIRAIEILM